MNCRNIICELCLDSTIRRAIDILDNVQNPKKFVKKELSVYYDKLNEGLAKRNEQE